MILCTMVAGERAKREFALLRRSMAKHHPEVGWFIAGQKGDDCDLAIVPSDLSRVEPAWTRLMVVKLELARIAIDNFGYCAYMDADMVLLRPGMPRFPELLESAEVVLSPHFTSPWRENIYGRYSAGMFALKSRSLLDVWQDLTLRKMWYTEQKPLEISVQGRRKYELDQHHNCGNWRYPFSRRTASGIMVNGLPIVTYHGHLFDSTDDYDVNLIAHLVSDYPELGR